MVADYTPILTKVDKLWDKVEDKIYKAADKIEDMWYAPEGTTAADFVSRFPPFNFAGSTPPNFAKLISKHYKSIWKQAELIEKLAAEYHYEAWDLVHDFIDDIPDEDIENDDFFESRYHVQEEILEDLLRGGRVLADRDYPILSEGVVEVMGECTDEDLEFNGRYADWAGVLAEAVVQTMWEFGY